MSDPVFPPELERKIFEMAFDPKNRPTNGQMMLVAKRVRLWIRPLVYRVFDQRIKRYLDQRVYGVQRPFPSFKDRPPFIDMDEICQLATHLVVDETVHTILEVTDLIYQCPNLVNIGCWGELDPLGCWDSISGLDHLKRLSGEFKYIVAENLTNMPIFASLTHLEILYPGSKWPLHALKSLTNLTHLSIYLKIDESDANRRKLGPMISTWPQIQIFLFSIDQHQLSDKQRQLYDQDHRVVFVHFDMNSEEDWHRGAQGLPDIWYHAGNMVYARKNKLLKSGDYQGYPMTEDFPWLRHLTEAGKEWFLSL